MTARITVLLLLATLCPLAAEKAKPMSLSHRANATHQKFLESRRNLFSDLSDPFQVVGKAKVIQEDPEPWKTPEKTRWRRHITATVFWVGEQPSPRNPTPNNASAWDPNWQTNFGGVDRPELRNGYLPKSFVPKQNPFYIALPYNDMLPNGEYRPEAAEVIPWFYKVEQGTRKSVCQGRWVAIHREGKICYAQWSDVGPFTTDDWEYVFQGKRPRPNLNGSAGIDLSPAVRDYIQLNGNHKVDWKFVEDFEVPDGPWKSWKPTKR